jgi:signal transduction histidine kinase
MRELSLHLLDIAENSVAAGAQNITIRVCEDLAGDRMFLSIQDDGKGMDAETAAKIVDPFVTSRTTRKVGLGLPLLKEAAEFCNGYLRIDSTLGQGTLVEVGFQHSHIDRMPLGDLASTILTLLISSLEIHWVFEYQVNQDRFILDDAPIKQELEGIPLSDPLVIGYLRELINQGVAGLQPILS